MHQQQIDIVDAELLQALVDRACEGVGVQVFVRHLGAEKYLVARHAGGAHAFADAALGAVLPGGVEVAIAELERLRDDLAAIAERRGAEADRRNIGGTGLAVGEWETEP